MTTPFLNNLLDMTIVYSLLVGSRNSLKMLPCNILRELQPPTNSEYTIVTFVLSFASRYLIT